MALDDATLPNVIADVGATLRQIIRDRVDTLNPEGRVVFTSPADVDVAVEPRLGLFLYQIQETPDLRNQPPHTDVSASGRQVQALDLFYLVTPYTQQLEDGHRLLGRVMRVFFEYGVLQGSVLQGSLADIGQELRVLHHPLVVEDVNRLWGVFPNKAYRLSVAYQVTPVRLLGTAAQRGARVVSRELGYAQVVDRGRR